MNTARWKIQALVLGMVCLALSKASHENVSPNTQSANPTPDITDSMPKTNVCTHASNRHHLSAVNDADSLRLPGSPQGNLVYQKGLSHVSKPCVDHLLHFVRHEGFFALQTQNIATDIKARLHRLRDVWPGTFKQCLTFRSAGALPLGSNEKIFGKYCLAYFLDPAREDMDHEHVALLNGKRFNARYPTAVPETGICLPESCSSVDAQEILKFYLGDAASNWTVFVTEERCQTERSKPNKLFSKVVRAGLIILASLVIIGTLVEYIDQMLTSRSGPKREQRGNKVLATKESLGKSVITCFSLFSNGWYLFRNDVELPGSIISFNGARFLAAMGCQIVHTVILGNVNGWRNVDEAGFIQAISYRGFFHISIMLQVAVIMSAAGIGMSAFHRLYEKDKHLFLTSFYLRRIFRLSTPYFISIALFIGILPNLFSAPRWPDVLYNVETCKMNWWTNLLFINNYVHADRMCLFHSWYLSTDIHLLIIAPLLILAFYRSPRLGVTVMLAFVSLSVIKLGYHSYYDGLNPRDLNINPSLWKMEDYFLNLYLLPFSHLGCYSLSIGMAYFIYTRAKQFTLSPRMQCWTSYFFAILFWSPMWIWYRHEIAPLSLVEGVLSETFGSIAFTSGLCFLCIALEANFQDPYTKAWRWFLYRKIFVFTSKLSYSVYLLHVTVTQVYFVTRPEPLEYSPTQFLKVVFGLLFLTHLLAIPFTLLAELPFLRLERLFEQRRKAKKVLGKIQIAHKEK